MSLCPATSGSLPAIACRAVLGDTGDVCVCVCVSVCVCACALMRAVSACLFCVWGSPQACPYRHAALAYAHAHACHACRNHAVTQTRHVWCQMRIHLSLVHETAEMHVHMHMSA